MTSLRAFAAPVIVFMAGYLFPHALKSITYSKHHRSRVNPFVSKTPQSQGPQRTVTIQDVARTARVSTATVSRALSNPDLLSDTTRAAVLDAIRTTGYRVNQAARNLRMQRAGAVLILVPDLGKPFYSRILAGISDGFADSDYAVLIADTENRPLREGELLDYFLDGRIDGVISLDGGLDPHALQACVDAGLGGRIVFLCEWVEGWDFPVIRADNAEGARLAVRHLHGLGHTRIAHVTGPEGNVLTVARRRGMLEERARLGLPTRAEWIIRGDFSLESGHRAAELILGMAERPTAVFCAADMVAFGLIARLQAGGLSVPGDISVVGFDDIDMSEYYVPSLTTIRQDRLRLGREGAEALLQRLGPRAPGADPDHAMVELDLVVRESTAPPKA
jgi:LacI family repressor for deo operon, udp, cdd, tsx, nupC, and nupG